ncbi:ABC transporter ATP-binding protein, partial [Leucobacter sp. M11]|uniref:ABC transporter ATP-binding protein n=1 Tax=Leucobacter sp. M11 TaxID=2993565 RepID=UPI002D804449
IGTPSLAPIVDGVSLRVAPGEILGVVGESGSGKTTLGLALLNYARGGTVLEGGRVLVGDRDLATLSAREVRALRGRTVAYIPQSPASALNPALRIRTQLLECLDGEHDHTLARLAEVMAEVALPGDAEFLSRYPHQLSGGQQQRVAIAMAFIARPALIVLDEPTTGLDVSTQKHVLETVRELCTNSGSAAIYISHDLAVVSDLSDRIAVLYAGRVVEQGPTAAVIASPAHPYTRLLLAATPAITGARRMRGIPGNAPSPISRPPGCSFAPRCPLAVESCRSAPPEERARPEPPAHAAHVGDAAHADHAAHTDHTVDTDDTAHTDHAADTGDTAHLVRCYRAELPLPEPREASAAAVIRAPGPDAQPSLRIRDLRAGYRRTEILHGIDLDLFPGECLALLGESGSGKTTLSSCVVGLHTELSGVIELGGRPLAAGSYRRTAEQRQRIQYVFQNPYDSLNPRRTVRELLTQPLVERRGRRKLSEVERNARVAQALEQAMLRPDHAYRFPEQLSGGERQRVAIARALVTRPDILVCDEITSALDVSVQASIVELLARLQREQGLTLLFITHNIALVRNIAQRVAILQHGTIVETQDTEALFAHPEHPYTQSLIEATPDFSRSLGAPHPRGKDTP